jgi:hypothetical protein
LTKLNHPLVDAAVSADPMMKCSPFRKPAPLTATEKARRAAVLEKSQEPGGQLTAAVTSEPDEAAEVMANTSAQENSDAFKYGHHAAQILSDCRRDVAVAPKGMKLVAFQEVAEKIGNAVSGQWLPKAVMADRLFEIAEAHRSFGLNTPAKG